MSIRKTPGEKIFDGFNAGLLFIFVVLTLYPLLHVAFASVSEPARIVRHTGLMLYPLGYSLEAYRMLFQNPMIAVGYANTLFYVVAGTALNLVLTTLGAYVLSRKGLYWKNTVTFLIVFTMFFNSGLIPFYLTVMNLGLLDSRLALIIPGAINTMNLIVMRTSFASIPEELEESARIDGANDWLILFRIMLPLSGPMLAVMTLFYAVHHWNAWFHAMIFLRNRDLYPVQLILREILITNSLDTMTTGVSTTEKDSVGETIKYACIIVVTVPILFVYPFLQKYFVKGVMIGAVKQ